MKTKKRIIVAALLFSFLIIGFTLSDQETYKKWFTEKYSVKSPYVPADLNFAGEAVPIDQEDIRERLDRELMSTVYWQSNTMMLLKRSKKYFPVIEQILVQHNIPVDFKYLCVTESGLSNVTSPSGAQGFWQLMTGTAKPYGLEMNDYVDERNNLEKSTKVACEYLLNAYKNFNNWTLAAASYNRGVGGTLRDLNFQKGNSFYDLYLNSETSRYIFRILSYKLIFENPEQYGFILKDSDYYKMDPSMVITVDTTINDLSEWALSHETSYKMVKLLNPWLKDRSLPNRSRTVYRIEIPYKP